MLGFKTHVFKIQNILTQNNVENNQAIINDPDVNSIKLLVMKKLSCPLLDFSYLVKIINVKIMMVNKYMINVNLKEDVIFFILYVFLPYPLFLLHSKN